MIVEQVPMDRGCTSSSRRAGVTQGQESMVYVRPADRSPSGGGPGMQPPVLEWTPCVEIVMESRL